MFLVSAVAFLSLVFGSLATVAGGEVQKRVELEVDLLACFWPVTSESPTNRELAGLSPTLSAPVQPSAKKRGQIWIR
jgi:hypothetical protein